MNGFFQFFTQYFSHIDNIIYQLIIIVGIVVGLSRLKGFSRCSKILLILLISTCLIEFLAFYAGKTFHNNICIYTPFTILQCFLIAYSFATEIKKVTVVGLFTLFFVFAIFNGLVWQPIWKEQAYNTILVECLIVIIWFFIFLTTYFSKNETNHITVYPLFWVGAGLLIFSIASIISFGFAKLSFGGESWSNKAFEVKKYSNYLLYLSFIPAFLSPQKSLNDTTAGK